MGAGIEEGRGGAPGDARGAGVSGRWFGYHRPVMASYRYTALTASGQRVAGSLTAANQQAVLAELETRRLAPIEVEEERSGPSMLNLPVLRGRISTRAMAGAYQQLSDLLRAGVPLLRSLRLLGGSKATPRLASAFKELADAVAEGADVADAMARRPEIFDPVHVAMVRAGEKGGFLEPVMSRLGRLLNGQAELRGKIIGNMVYPAVLVIFFVAVLGLIFAVFIPMFRPIFDRMQSQLGPMTNSVLLLSTLVRSYGLLLVGGVVGAAAGLYTLARRPKMKARLARWQLKTPVIGPLVKAIAIARFCRVLGTMLANNVPLLAAMAIAKDAAGHPVLAEAIGAAAEAVRAGQRLADPLADSGLLSEDVLEMIRVGEQANNLDVVLITIADTLDGRVDRLLSAAVKLIEPLMLMLIGLVVAWVAMALILPMTKIGQMV